MTTLMQDALNGGYGVGYFEAWDTYSLEAVVEAAEETNSPVILGFGGMMASAPWLDNGGVEMLGALGSVVAARARVPVSLILNEAQTRAQTLHGIEAGFNAVMLDTSAWEWQEAVRVVAELTQIAHARGVTVEAELGRLPDATADGIDSSTAYLTDPIQARDFVAATGVDCLAVSFGNVHLLTAHDAPVDMNHLAAIREQVAIPFVIHGGTSFPAHAIPRAIALGVAKFNVGTILKTVFLRAVQEVMGTWQTFPNVHEVLGSHKETDFLEAGKRAMKEKTRALMQLYGSVNRARIGKETTP
jgi:fructose-bisphosphate aldolase class II